jgi:crotonobetainyl-CoA:carnitine CoA-transferase CaiB-like acyl-CoA transferase
MPGPLQDVKVLDITHVMAGAFCSMLLADLGADVVKVERLEGDSMRAPVGSRFQPFDAVNHSKRSLAIDLSDRRGADALRRLVARADVVVENFRPGVLDRLGLGYRELAAVNPALIYCSISGFGATGPYRDRGGFDLVAQAMSGIMSFTGEPGRPPVKVGVPIADLNAGLFGALGVVSAYVHRMRTGLGQLVDTSLLEGALAYTVWESALYFAEGEVARPVGSAHRLAAPYEAFRTSDGYLTVGAANQRTWRRLCEVVERPELAEDPRFSKPGPRLANREELAAILREVFSSAPTHEWQARLLLAGVPCGPIYSIDEVLADEHVQARGMVVEARAPKGGTTRALGIPVKLSLTPGGFTRPAPLLGEHTTEVLAEHGFSKEEIAELEEAGVISRSTP